MKPWPHRITLKRITASTVDANGREIIGALTTVEAAIKAMICPAGVAMQPTPFAQMETAENVILLDPLNASGVLRRVKAGDLLVNDRTDEVWVAQKPGEILERPTTFNRAVPLYDHLEVVVERGDPESGRQ